MGKFRGFLIIDMINGFTFSGAEDMFPAVERAAERIARLKRRMKQSRSTDPPRER